MAGHIARTEVKVTPKRDKIIFLIGPTAVGKSRVALCLAKRLNAEIVSCDSMQVYKGMDILTWKPAPALRKRVPHHLIGTIPSTRQYNVSRYRKDALKKISEIIGRKKTPLFVGGTGLYMTILVDGIFEGGQPNKLVRQRLYRLLKKKGNFFLYEKLKKVDPAIARKIHPHDAKRLIRALEVFETTGRPISELHNERRGLIGNFDVEIFCLNRKRQSLYKMIDRRVDEMFRRGVVSEVGRLTKCRLSKTARYAIGIREIAGYLKGAYNLIEAKKQMKHNSRLYAKRQITWFRKDKRIKWIEVKDNENPVITAKRILCQLKKHF
jgi:tRNA dimethylallyltransferase